MKSNPSQSANISFKLKCIRGLCGGVLLPTFLGCSSPEIVNKSQVKPTPHNVLLTSFLEEVEASDSTQLITIRPLQLLLHPEMRGVTNQYPARLIFGVTWTDPLYDEFAGRSETRLNWGWEDAVSIVQHGKQIELLYGIGGLETNWWRMQQRMPSAGAPWNADSRVHATTTSGRRGVLIATNANVGFDQLSPGEGVVVMEELLWDFVFDSAVVIAGPKDGLVKNGDFPSIEIAIDSEFSTGSLGEFSPLSLLILDL